jgi:hypothetical protein
LYGLWWSSRGVASVGGVLVGSEDAGKWWWWCAAPGDNGNYWEIMGVVKATNMCTGCEGGCFVEVVVAVVEWGDSDGIDASDVYGRIGGDVCHRVGLGVVVTGLARVDEGWKRYEEHGLWKFCYCESLDDSVDGIQE